MIRREEIIGDCRLILGDMGDVLPALETPKDDELRALAWRISGVINAFREKPPLTPETVDLEMVAELCWAIGVTPRVSFSLDAALATPGEG